MRKNNISDEMVSPDDGKHIWSSGVCWRISLHCHEDGKKYISYESADFLEDDYPDNIAIPQYLNNGNEDIPVEVVNFSNLPRLMRRLCLPYTLKVVVGRFTPDKYPLLEEIVLGNGNRYLNGGNNNFQIYDGVMYSVENGGERWRIVAAPCIRYGKPVLTIPERVVPDGLADGMTGIGYVGKIEHEQLLCPVRKLLDAHYSRIEEVVVDRKNPWMHVIDGNVVTRRDTDLIWPHENKDFKKTIVNDADMKTILDVEECENFNLGRLYARGYREGYVRSGLQWQEDKQEFRLTVDFVINGVLYGCLSYYDDVGDECFAIVSSDVLVDELVDVCVPYEMFGIPICRLEKGVLPKQMKTLHVTSPVVYVGDDVNSFPNLQSVKVDPGNECYQVVDGRFSAIDACDHGNIP